MINPYGNQQSLIRVMGIEGAKAYQIAPNSTVALFDSGEDIMYIKSADSAGFPNIRIFEFQEKQIEPKQNNYISRDEFEDLRKELINVKQHIQERKDKHTI